MYWKTMLWKNVLLVVWLVAMAIQCQGSTPCLVKFYFASIFLQMLTKPFKQFVILSGEVNLGIFFGT